MTICRQIDEELSNALGRNLILQGVAQDNITFILCHPELLDKLDYWQDLNEDLILEEGQLRQILEECYLQGIEYEKFNVTPSNYSIRVETSVPIPEQYLHDWRIIR